MRDVQVMDEGSIIKAAMKERRLIQIDLADKLGIKQSSLSGNINRRRISMEVFSTILNAMDYDVAVVDRETGEVMWKVSDK